jgi:hypothetical protein
MLFNKRYRKCFPSDFHELTKTIITAIFGKSCRYCELNLHVSPKTFFFFFCYKPQLRFHMIPVWLKKSYKLEQCPNLVPK